MVRAIGKKKINGYGSIFISPACDVFSLGCVFLEIITVLGGLKPLEISNGNISRGVYRSPDMVDAWIRLFPRLNKQLPNIDARWKHLLWIVQQMMRTDPRERPTATMVWAACTTLYEGAFCGNCCRHTNIDEVED